MDWIDSTFIRTRRTATLARWVDDLSEFRWPKELGLPEDRNAPGTPRRDAAMRQILIELGWRFKRDLRSRK